jgi:hypothetical protein
MRRSFGSVFRRRLGALGPGGNPRYAPGWYVRARHGGQEVRRYGGPDRATALEVLATLKRQLDRERLLGESPQADSTFVEFLPTFLAKAEREWTSQSFKTVRLLAPNRLVPFFGAMRLRDVTRVHVEQFLARQSKVSGATRNRLKSALPEGNKNWQLVVIVHGRISTTAGNVQLYTTWDTATATAVGSTVLLSTVAVSAQDISSGMGPMVRLTFVLSADSAATISVYLTPKSE